MVWAPYCNLQTRHEKVRVSLYTTPWLLRTYHLHGQLPLSRRIMDLFDDLDIEPVKARTFRAQVDIDIASDAESQDINRTQAIINDQSGSPNAPPFVNVLNMSSSSILNTKTTLEPSVKDSAPAVDRIGTGNALLSKIKRRLNGELESEPESALTQNVDEHDISTQRIQPEISSTQPSQTQVIATQNVSAHEHFDSIPETQKIGPATTVSEVQTQVIEKTTTKESQTIQEDELTAATLAIGSGDSAPTQAIAVAPTPDHESDGEATISLRRNYKSIGFLSDDEDEVGEQTSTQPTVKNPLSIGSSGINDAASAEENVTEDEPQNVAKGTKLFFSDSESDTEEPLKTQSDAREDREKRIALRVEKVRAERLLKKQQEDAKKSKDLDNVHTTKKSKTFNEKAGEDEKESIDAESSESEDEDKHERQGLDIEVVTRKTFAKTDLFAAFGFNKHGSRDIKSEPIPTKSETAETTPLKSPAADIKLAPPAAHDDINLDSDSDDDDFEIKDMLKPGPLPSKVKSQKPVMGPLVPPPKLDKASSDVEVINLDDSDSDFDIEAPVSKSKVLDVKAKFSKKSIEKKKAKHRANIMTKNSILKLLKSSARQQITADMKERRVDAPEMTKDEIEEVLDVEKLLMKHLQHANTVSEQEKQKARENRLSHDDTDEEWESDVPDSDVDASRFNDEDDDDDDDDDDDADNDADAIPSSQIPKGADKEEDDEESTQISKKSRRKNVIDDDNDDEQEEMPASKISIADVLGKSKKGDGIDLGFFGGNLSQIPLDSNSQNPKNDLGVSMTQLFEKGSPQATVYGEKAFQQLRDKNNCVIGDDLPTADLSRADDSVKEDSFIKSVTQNDEAIDYDAPATQLTEIEAPSANPSFTAPAPSQMESFGSATIRDAATQVDPVDTTDQDTQKDEEDGSPVKVHARKRLMKKTELSDIESGSDNDDADEEEETEEERQERLRQAEIFKELRRKDFIEEKRRKKELKSKGLDMIMENEAEESEDEWVGAGGADGEKYDEMDSEDEKMFDDITRVKENRSELVKRLNDESAESDQKMLMKILKDLETGNWKKRGRGEDMTGLDYEDEEDALIRKYRIYKQNKKRALLEEDANLRQLAKDKKSQAFFQSIMEDSQQDAKNEIFGGVESESSQSEDEDENDDPFVEAASENKASQEVVKKTKKRTITQAYVQKSLSFLNELDGGDSPAPEHNDLDEDDSFDDLHTLKQNSVIQMPIQTPQKRKTIVLDGENSSPTDMFKMPSMTRSFQTFETTTVRNTDVTFSTSSKVVSGASSSIMSLGKSRVTSTKLDVKSQRVLKAQKVKRQVKSMSNGVVKRLASVDGGAFE
ncbi:CYFA0S10e03422g1_1 [Cyberlindnera fabianii]|uniref:CYFA0S10e03422g1_1 n=1 Tax=Cyberlindnera fabianii TaxID=36022 RepID=A0A061AYY3_CYBFA|nr:CYFA0S10e03422g1_1 [Cyberlindnera fabianii]